jgi:hypothetical protein
MAKASRALALARASKARAKASQAPATGGSRGVTLGSRGLVTPGSRGLVNLGSRGLVSWGLVNRGSPRPARAGRAMAWETRTPWARIHTSYGSRVTRARWQRR